MKILKNIDVYITIILAIVVSILGVLGIVESNAIMGAILALIALVSFSLLSNRNQVKKMEGIIKNIESSQDLAEKFLTDDYDRAELLKQFKDSTSTYLWGLNFTRTIPLLLDSIENSLMKGHNVKILMIKPNSCASKMAELRSINQDESTISNVVVTNLNHLSKLQEKDYTGKLEVKLIDYLPSTTIVVFNTNTTLGLMYLRLQTFRVQNERRPTFKLLKQSNKEWFKFYIQQFENVWENAEYHNK